MSPLNTHTRAGLHIYWKRGPDGSRQSTKWQIDNGQPNGMPPSFLGICWKMFSVA